MDWLEECIERRRELTEKLKGLADEHGMVDVGFGAAKMLGVRQVDLDKVLVELENDGYLTHGGQIQQATAVRRIITIKVLCKSGVDRKDIFSDEVYRLTGGERE